MATDPFVETLFSLSDEKFEFDRARREWTLRLLLENEPHECLCGRMVRDEICLVEHRRTRKLIHVGSCCAEKYLRIPARKIFSGWAKVVEDPRRAFNEAFVDFAFRTGVMTTWERDFYKDTWRRRALSLEQDRKRRQINWKAIHEIRARRGEEPRRLVGNVGGSRSGNVDALTSLQGRH